MAIIMNMWIYFRSEVLGCCDLGHLLLHIHVIILFYWSAYAKNEYGASVYHIWWACCKRFVCSTHTYTANAKRTSNMNANELIDARTQAHGANIIKSNCVRCRGCWLRRKKFHFAFMWLWIFRFRLPFRRLTDTRCFAHISILFSYFSFFFSLTLPIHADIRTPWSQQADATARCSFAQKYDVRYSLSSSKWFAFHFYFRVFLMRTKVDGESKEPSTCAVCATRSARHGIVDIHLIFHTRWIFHSISFHFMSFNKCDVGAHYSRGWLMCVYAFAAAVIRFW